MNLTVVLIVSISSFKYFFEYVTDRKFIDLQSVKLSEALEANTINSKFIEINGFKIEIIRQNQRKRHSTDLKPTRSRKTPPLIRLFFVFKPSWHVKAILLTSIHADEMPEKY